MKSLLFLWYKLAHECASRCCTSATMDCKTVRVRTEHEGLSFLTITLPDFGKSFEKSLDLGQVDPRLFTAFRCRGGLPLFLGGFLDRVFSRGTGTLLDSPCIDAILSIRQLSLMYGKISVPCSDARVRKAIRGYIECEQEVREADAARSGIDTRDFQRVASMLFSSAFSEIDRKIYYGELLPKHGPGATADRLMGNQKYGQRTWTKRLEKLFPVGDFLLPNHRYYDELERVDLLEPEAEIPVKVITVPKTLKTPRIIAMEPTAMMYMQQAILRVILDSLGSVSHLDRMLGFDDQVPNQQLALEGSLHGNLATLDLSEASDRVSNQLVRDMTAQWPYLHAALDATRSRKADVRGHGVKRLSKFASMGSALCFPIEAMVFLTVIFVGIERELNVPLSPSFIKQMVGKVRVYGDDIIVPVDYVRSVVTTLETFGFRVNRAKSFWTGKFRESCGKEYYDGNDVSIIRFRQEFPTHRKDATEVISAVSFSNQAFKAGYWETVKWLDEEIRRVIKHYPVVLPSSRMLGRHSFMGIDSRKLHPDLHVPIARGYAIRAKLPYNPVGESGALLKCLLELEERENALGCANAPLSHLNASSGDSSHLERSGRPKSVSIKLGWFPVT